MDNKRKASSANGGGSEADERQSKRRKMPPVSPLGFVMLHPSMVTLPFAMITIHDYCKAAGEHVP